MSLRRDLEVEVTAANQQYREQMLRQKVKEQESGDQGQERERTDDNAADWPTFRERSARFSVAN